MFRVAFQILTDAIADHAFPATSVAITHKGQLVALRAFGRFVYAEDKFTSQSVPLSPDHGNCEVTPGTLFDIASVTKIVATTTMAMILYERGLLNLDSKIEAVVPEFVSELRATTGGLDPRRGSVTMRDLLAHSSGLPAYEKLFLKYRTRDKLLRAAYAVPLTADPGSRTEYSDIGFILLGVALERIAGETLDFFCQKEIFAPLGMKDTRFNPPPELCPRIAPTADERDEDTSCSRSPARQISAEKEHFTGIRSTFRGRIVQGEVQDENAYVLGGVAGHAGLFSTAADLAKFANAMLQCGAAAASPGSEHAPARGNQILRPETIQLFTTRQDTPPGTSRALGWDTPSTPSQSGKYFSPQSYGHLGYTGTSLWIDPAREVSVTLLTNRTWPDCSNQAIKKVRPMFHDAVMEALQNFR